MSEHMRPQAEISVIDAESAFMTRVANAGSISGVQQICALASDPAISSDDQNMERLTGFFYSQAGIISVLIKDLSEQGIEKTLDLFPEVSTGEVVTEKYGIAEKVRGFLDKIALSEKEGVDIDLTKQEVDLVI